MDQNFGGYKANHEDAGVKRKTTEMVNQSLTNNGTMLRLGHNGLYQEFLPIHGTYNQSKPGYASLSCYDFLGMCFL